MTTVVDHRPRVAAEKRERMRMRLIESALLVFARKGMDAPVIDEVITMAEVSRGTFYNYFKTNDELMAGVMQQLGNELLGLVEQVVIQRADPAERLASGVRIVLHTARQYPHLGRFAAKVGPEQTLQNSLAMHLLPRDIQAGMDAGEFVLPDAQLGVDLVVGVARSALFAIATRANLRPTYPEEVAYLIMLGLGLPKGSAQKLAMLPISPVELPPSSLLARSRERSLPEA